MESRDALECGWHWGLQVTHVRKELEQLATRIQRCEMDITAMARQQQELTAQLADLQARRASMKRDSAKQQALEGALAKEEKVRSTPGGSFGVRLDGSWIACP